MNGSRLEKIASTVLATLAVALAHCSAPPGEPPEKDGPAIHVLVSTGLGEIEIEIDAERAPVTSANFLRYVDGGFYDGGRFHRTVRLDNQPDQEVLIEVVQAGTGTDPDPDRSAEDYPPIVLERTDRTGLSHKDGVVSMARLGPDTATSDFFICIGDQPALDFGGARNPDGQGFAAFGRVVRGMEVVRAIQAAPAQEQSLVPPITILRAVRRSGTGPGGGGEAGDGKPAGETGGEAAGDTGDGAKAIIKMARDLMRIKDNAGAIALLEDLTAGEPSNARAWTLLGYARHVAGRFDAAIEAHHKAMEFDETLPRALYNAACTRARMNDREAALGLLQRLKQTGRFDLTQVGLDPDLESLHGDARLDQLLPSPEEYRRPFVEKTRVIREWTGEAQGDSFGWIARNIGDVDGDGVNDLTTSAPNKNIDGESAGRVYAYSGRTGALLWTRSGKPGDRLGLGIEAAGDTNADGIPDVVAGAPGAGLTYVYSGRDGTILLTLEAEEQDETFGRKVSDVGDLDRDGHADILVGAPGNDAAGKDAGRAAVYSGRDGSVLVDLRGEREGDGFGSSAAGYTDGQRTVLVVGAPNAGPENGGRTYVYEGASAEPRFVIEADESGSNLGGMFVSVVGDLNADRVPDIYASDWSNGAKGPTTGRIYVHSGRGGERILTLTGEAEGDGFGIGPADAGDVDGDGHDDLIIGAWQHGGAAPSGGKVYLYSGKDGSLLRTYTSRVMGDTLGFDATGMGDVDGDGTIDFLLTAAWSAINGPRSGRMFIVSGETGG